MGILAFLFLVLGTGFLHGDKTVSNTYIIPAGTFRPGPIVATGSEDPSQRSADVSPAPAYLSGGTAIAIAFRDDEISTPYPEAKNLFVAGMTNLTQYGRYNESLHYFEGALAVDRNFSEAWTGKGVALHNLRRYNESIQCYDYSLKIHPGNAGVWNLKEVTFRDMGQYEAAEESKKRAAELDPRYGVI